MTGKFIVFDFDGTIADTVEDIFDIMNYLSEEFGYKKLKKSDAIYLRDKKSDEIVFEELGISRFKMPFVHRRLKEELSKLIQNAKPVPGIKKALLGLKKNGYKLGILSSNSEETVRKFLENNKMDFFDFIYSGSSLFGKSKVINDMIKRQGIPREETVYVADETRDVEAAKKSGLKIISVMWGMNSGEILKKQNPDFLAVKPDDLVRILRKISQ